MIDLNPQLTTRQAAGLIRVHESSIKRWCDRGDLVCTTTRGGHRRISLNGLIAFAETQDLKSAVLNLSSNAAEVWHALSLAEGKRDYSAFSDLLFEGLIQLHSTAPQSILNLLQERRHPTSVVFDELLAPVLRRLGIGWLEGEIRIGDEHRISEYLRELIHIMHPPTHSESKDRKTKKPLALVGCGEGCHHDMGARIIRHLLEEHEWDTLYLGANVPVEEYAFQQSRYGAELICISIVPPSATSDAKRLMGLLARLYDPQTPYRLVLGGSTVHTWLPNELAGFPFREYKIFDTTDRFVRWIREIE